MADDELPTADRTDADDPAASPGATAGWEQLTSRLRVGRFRVVDRLLADRFTTALAVLSVAIGALVFLVAVEVFPYHSINHDEGVYLQQAAMLLDGSLWFDPPIDGTRPWFFVDDGDRLYPKYSPVPAGIFALGLGVGIPRLSLALVAAGNAALVGLLAAEAFDRRTGLLAALLLASAPLFLFNSAVFLPYAPTTFLNLLFALGYVRAHRRGSVRYAALAGFAVGLAFFARPFTALLFALPFVVHAAMTLLGAWYEVLSSGGGGAAPTGDDAPASDGATADPRDLTLRLGTVGAFGAAFVAVTLGYNHLVTGDALLFPYEAFAPRDGIGFGHREILNHERAYTPALALDANRQVLWRFATRWGPLGVLGTVLAALGVGVRLTAPAIRRFRSRDQSSPAFRGLPDLHLRTLLAALFVSVAAGNVYFWGNLNVLGDPTDPADGLLAYLGPFYHFDLLLPLSVFGAAGLLAVVDGARAVSTRSDRDFATRAVLALFVVLSVGVAGVAEANAVGPVAERNAEHRDDLAAVYEPFEPGPPDDALVFVPTPYGGWLNHPFQWLRNDPAFDGTAYVIDRDAADDFDAVDAFPDREPFRFTYRGQWPPEAGERTQGVLRPLTVREGERLDGRTHVGVVTGAQSATVRIAADGEAIQYGVERLPEERLTIDWTMGPDGFRLTSDGVRRFGDRAAVPIDGPTEATLTVTFVQPGGSTVSYRQAVTVEPTDDGVRAIWPGERRVCTLTTDCGTRGTYVEGGDYPTGVSFDANLTAVDR